MQSSNPIFNRSEGFNGRNARGTTSTGYTDPSQWNVGRPQQGGYGNQGYANQGYGNDPYATGYAPQPVDQGRMSIDSVVQKTGLTLGTVVVFAALTWLLTG
ncbi:MAG: Bax inhibitor/YccA family protein, partial [Marmoricola sp.]|nr:Bax inhibitor/YccA family protein [Marmoricola sp.]